MLLEIHFHVLAVIGFSFYLPFSLFRMGPSEDCRSMDELVECILFIYFRRESDLRLLVQLQFFLSLLDRWCIYIYAVCFHLLIRFF